MVSATLISRLREAAPAVLGSRGVAFAYLFGSHASGRAREDSDVDIAVRLKENGSGQDRIELRLAIAQELSEQTGIGRIEVAIFEDLPLPVRGRIVADHVLLYSADEPGRVELESRVAREFGDYQIAFRDLDRELLRATAEGRR